MAADMKAEIALRAVGDAEREQRDEEAAALLEHDVLPATDSALALAGASSMTTEWGRGLRSELIEVMKDRKAELPQYAAALRAHDWDRQLASVERQIAIEQRAMKTAASIQTGRADGG